MPKGTSTTSTNPLLTARRERVLTLYSVEADERLRQYDEDIERAAESEPLTRRAAGKTEATRLAEERDAYRDQVQADALKIRLRALNDPEFNALHIQHGPRKGNQLDAALGYNTDTFRAALIKACMVEPAVTDEQFDEWIAETHAGRIRFVFQSAYDLCDSEVDLPFGSAVSALTRLRARGQRQRGDTE